MSNFKLWFKCFWVCQTVLAWTCLHAVASDHADPVKVRFLGQPKSNLSGLFVFEHRNKLVIALCAQPGIVDNDSVDLRPLVYSIHIDCDAQIGFEDPTDINYEFNENQERTFRYGGWVENPENIKEDIVVQFSFENLGNVNPFAKKKAGEQIAVRPNVKVGGEKLDHQKLSKTIEENSWVGLRDDPFILQGFSNSNVVAFVIEIPLDQLGDNDGILVWGTATQHGKQVDHVGRSLRTMLPRLDFINKLHPSEHVKAIKQRHTNPGVVQNLKTYAASPIFGIRHYDMEPDVVIFTPSRWKTKVKDKPIPINEDEPTIAFPNGRRLTDDVAKLMSLRGDSLLWEVSIADAHADHKIRPSENGKPFLEEMPYLAAPNPNPSVTPTPELRSKTIAVLIASALGVVLLLVTPWVLYLFTRRKLIRLKTEFRNYQVG